MDQQPIHIRASTLAAEVCMTVMRDPTADPDLRFSCAHVALWMQDGPADLVAAASRATVARIQSQSEINCAA